MVEVIRFSEFELPPPSEKHFRRNTSFWFHEFEIEEVYRFPVSVDLELRDVVSVLPPDMTDHRIEAPHPGKEIKLTVWRSVAPEVFQEELRYASLPGAVGTVAVML